MRRESHTTTKRILYSLTPLAGVCFALLPARAGWQEQLQEQPAIDYRRGVRDAVARLQETVGARQDKLEYSEPRGYLDSVVKHLGVPAACRV